MNDELSKRVEEVREMFSPIESSVPLTHALVQPPGKEPFLLCGRPWTPRFWIIMQLVLHPQKIWSWDKPEGVTTVCPECQRVLDAL